MELTSTASTRIALALLCGLFACNAYRAATQSITTEEALAFDQRIRPPIRDILPHYNSGNHLLLTILIKRTVGLLRLSEFSFRLPSLLCGALYLWSVYRIASRTFGKGPFFVATVALLSLNPLVLDDLSAGRVYGMALAFWMCGLMMMIEYLESGPALGLGKLNLAALCLGLSVAAHLGFIFPAVGLTISFFIAAGLRGQLRWAAFTERLVIPAAVTGFVLLVIPLSHAEVSDFDFGSRTLNQTVRALISASLSIRVLGAATALGCVLLAAVLIGGVSIARQREKGTAQSLAVLMAGGLTATLTILLSVHRLTGLSFPSDQSALYLVPMVSLLVLGLAGTVQWRPTQIAALVLATVVVAQYVVEFRIGPYRDWPEDAGARSLVAALRRDARGRHVRIGASLALDPILTFYRARYRLANWEPMRQLPLNGDFDYYVLGPADSAIAADRRLQVLYNDGKLLLARR